MKKKMIGCLLAASCAAVPVAGLSLAVTPALAQESQGVAMRGSCGATESIDQVEWALEQNNPGDSTPTYTLKVTGTGAIKDWDSENDQPWYESRDSITKVEVGEGVTHIGAHAFRQLQSVTGELKLPGTLNSIGTCAFYMTPFTGFTVAGSSSSFSSESGVLYSQDMRTLVAYPVGSTSESYSAPASIEKVESYAFASVKALKSADFSSAMELSFVGQQAFESATNVAVVLNTSKPTLTLDYECLKGIASVSVDAKELKLAPYVFKDTKFISLANVDSCDCGFQGWWNYSGTKLVYDGKNANIFAGAKRVYVKGAELADELSKLPIRDQSTRAPDIAVTADSRFADGQSFVSDLLPSLWREGYAFIAWDDGQEYEVETKSTPTVTLKGKIYTAQWGHTVTYDGNGASEGSMSPQSIAEGNTTSKLTSNQFSKRGYTFSGWSTEEDGSGFSYKDQDVLAPKTNMVLYAKWTPNTYTIKFVGGSNSSGSMSDVTATYDSATKLPSNGFSREGYKFAGWSTSDGDDATVGFSDQTDVINLVENGEITLYAVWTKKGVLAPVLGDQVAVYNGAVQSYTIDGGYTVTYKQGENEVDNPVDAGVYDVEITHSEDDNYVSYHRLVSGGLTINRATAIVSVNDASIWIGSSLPSFGYEVSGLYGNDKLVTEPVFSCDSFDASKVGSYIVTASGASAGDNYEIRYLPGTLTVSRRPEVNPSHPVETPAVEGGSVSVSSSSAKAGDVVCAKVAADSAHRVYGLRVVDEAGTEVAVSAGSAAGEFTFVMPKTEVTVTPVFAKNFADADYDAWYASSLDLVSARGIMNGIGGTSDFGVGKTLTRSELAALLYNYAVPGHGSEVADINTTGMPDVEGSQWYTSAANWAVANGVINGCVAADGSRTFDPTGEVTLEQLVAVLQNLTHGTGSASLSKFGDAGSVSGWAEGAVSWAVSAGLVNGSNEDGGVYLHSDADMARERVAAVIANAFHQDVLK